VKKVLVPVDGSAHAQRAVDHAIDMCRGAREVEVHLLNVQIPITSGQVRLFVSKESIDEYHRMEGESALAPAKAALDRTEIPYTTAIEVGHVPETIVSYCKTHGCDQIVMGTRGLSAVGSLVLGSVANKVIHNAEVPVTLVK
jgi:nucleotide-binding universal stress UspA family protein